MFGGRDSYHLLIDLDLHNQPLSLFETRLRILVDRFHRQHRCHFQVANTAAGGVHLILFFGRPGRLSTRRKWLLNEFQKLDILFPEGLLTKQTKQGQSFNIEVYPDPNKACRLPLARERTMLLDKPLPLVQRRGKNFQDVVTYMRWLDQSQDATQYMPKDAVIKFITERLDLSKAKDAAPKAKKATRRLNLKSNDSKDTEALVKKTTLKGKTKSAIVSYWRDGLPAFSQLNSAIRTTLQALHAEGVDQTTAEAIVFQFARDIPNKQLSSRLVSGLPLIKKEIARQARGVFGQDPNDKWKRSIRHWSSYGFRVSDISTWDRMPNFEQVVLDCQDINFSENERQTIISVIAPIVVGPKQANNQVKQAEVIKAVAHFLRYVKCCSREIPVPHWTQFLQTSKSK